MPPSSVVPPTVEELSRVPVLQGLPEEHLQWLLDRGDFQEYPEGTVLTRTADPIDELWLLLDGTVEFYMDVNGRLVHYFSFGREPPADGAGGLIPYSRLRTSPGWSYTRGRVRQLRLHKSRFRELEQVSPELVQRLIATMTERARVFATRKLQEEKISALGKLAAGLAHELNNPSAAIQRAVEELSSGIVKNYDLTPGLLECGVSGPELWRMRELVLARAEGHRSLRPSLSERMRAEDDLVERLRSYRIESPETLAEALVESGVDAEVLAAIRQSLPEGAFSPVMDWLCNLLVSTRVIRDVEEASSRISQLVRAMKSHVHMDRSTAMEAVDVHRGIDDTLTILGHKLRKKNIRVTREYDESLPDVHGYGGELNQVWMNLIDNAIDAMAPGGELTIRTAGENDGVRVMVQDDGSGIPPEIQSRIFDPFFTTKKQGEGTGMGLDLVLQSVTRHRGEVKVFSSPGDTRFHVTLPIAHGAPSPAAAPGSEP